MPLFCILLVTESIDGQIFIPTRYYNLDSLGYNQI